MSKFDYMNFDGGSEGTQFVVHVGKYTADETVELYEAENGDKLYDQRKPTMDDIVERRVKYYVRVPDWCGHDSDGGGCYTFCGEADRRSFPVWVINLEELRI